MPFYREKLSAKLRDYDQGTFCLSWVGVLRLARWTAHIGSHIVQATRIGHKIIIMPSRRIKTYFDGWDIWRAHGPVELISKQNIQSRACTRQQSLEFKLYIPSSIPKQIKLESANLQNLVIFSEQLLIRQYTAVQWSACRIRELWRVHRVEKSETSRECKLAKLEASQFRWQENHAR
jgi:hypothetical protein